MNLRCRRKFWVVNGSFGIFGQYDLLLNYCSLVCKHQLFQFANHYSMKSSFLIANLFRSSHMERICPLSVNNNHAVESQRRYNLRSSNSSSQQTVCFLLCQYP